MGFRKSIICFANSSAGNLNRSNQS